MVRLYFLNIIIRELLLIAEKNLDAINVLIHSIVIYNLRILLYFHKIDYFKYVYFFLISIDRGIAANVFQIWLDNFVNFPNIFFVCHCAIIRNYQSTLAFAVFLDRHVGFSSAKCRMSSSTDFQQCSCDI